MKNRQAADGLPSDMRDKPVSKDEKMWRISSLTASVDDETTILILP